MLGHAKIVSLLFDIVLNQQFVDDDEAAVSNWLAKFGSRVDRDLSCNNSNNDISSNKVQSENSSFENNNNNNNSPNHSKFNDENTNILKIPGLQKYLTRLRMLSVLNFVMRNKQNWSPMDEAKASAHRPTIQIFLKFIHFYQIILGIEHSKTFKKATQEKILQKDFKLSMKFDLKTWIPILSRWLPSDQIELFHKNNKFRLDFHIIPGGGDTGAMLWKKGSYSIIVDSGRKVGFFLDHDNKKGQILMESGDATAGSNNNQSKTRIKAKISQTDQTLGALVHQKLSTNNWISDPDESHDAPLFLAEFMHLDKEEISKQANLVMSQPIQKPGLSTHKVVFNLQHKNMFGFGKGKSSTFGRFQASNYSISGLEFVVRSRNEHLTDEDKSEYEKMKSINNSIKSIGGSQKPQNGKPSRPQVSDAYGGYDEEEEEFPTIINTNANKLTEESLEKNFKELEDQFEKSLSTYRKSLPVEQGYSQPTFDEYLKIDPENFTHQLRHGRKINRKEKRHPVKGKISLSEEFPIKKESFLAVLRQAAPKFRHFARLKQFIEMKTPPGFPVHLEAPIFASISAELTVLDLEVFQGSNSGSSPNSKAKLSEGSLKDSLWVWVVFT